MSETSNIPLTMKSWQVVDYNNTIKLNKNTPVPKIIDPHQVLIKVMASSINIIDIYMTEGYGHVLFNFLRKIHKYTRGIQASEFPVILGRDFVGEVLSVGSKVDTQFTVGAIVMGITLPPSDGSHAEYMVAYDSEIIKKPADVKPEDAAAILYAGMTAWSALNVGGDFWFRERTDKKVLVLGASGGVGTVAVQLLKYWGAKVFATTRGPGGLEAVKLLQPEKVININDSVSFLDEIKEWGPFDVILDAANIPEAQIPDYVQILKPYNFGKFISLQPTILPNVDKFGVILGAFKSLFDLFATNIRRGSILKTSFISYGIVIPSRKGLEELASLVEQKKLQAVIDSVYSFDEADKAYERIGRRGLKGKVVLKH